MNVHVPSRRAAALVASLALAAGPRAASAWWNDEWSARKQIRVDTSAAAANVTDPIGPFALLVRLHVGNFRFDAAKEDGSDLRFVAGDDRTPLRFHLEKYDPLLGEAIAWVALPELKPGSATEIWLYYKNPKAPSAEDAKGTYDAGAALVYHFAERLAPPRDSTTWGNHAASAAGATDAQIGAGLRLDGAAVVQIPPTPSLAWAAGGSVTWSVWLRPAASEASAIVFSRRSGAGALVLGLEGGRPYVEVTGSGPAPARAVAANSLPGGGWHHVAFTTGDEIVLWVDGIVQARTAGRLPALDGPSTLGGEAPAFGGGSAGGAARAPGFQGDLDELQIARVARPVGFVRASVVSQGADPGKFIVMGQDEEQAGLGSGYLAILIRSVTIDGWVVIGVLAVMMIVSWMVMAGKASYLSTVERANDRFAEAFRQQADLARLVEHAGHHSGLGEARVVQASPLYRMFQVGANEVRKRVVKGAPLSAEGLEVVRASLDAALVRENQRLGQRMVLLTIAISGGPFLGLLGTVVGVMITFASIAAAGDVNVNAIAPGIAAALVATVAGLAVAIPALFGYNWLLTRIKDVTATLQVFVDELVTRLAETYGQGSARDRQGARSLAAGE